jgi:hypothetical protein
MISHRFSKKPTKNNIQFYALGFLYGFAYKASKNNKKISKKQLDEFSG